jgi:hypothetical protein
MIASGWQRIIGGVRILLAISGTFSAPDVRKFLADDSFSRKKSTEQYASVLFK